MLFLGLIGLCLIGIMISIYKFSIRGLSISVVTGAICIMFLIGGMCETERKLYNIKNKQIAYVESYQASIKGNEEWEWLVKKLSESNDQINEIENDARYILFDIAECCCRSNFDNYRIIMDNDKIIIPDNYGIISPRKVQV